MATKFGMENFTMPKAAAPVELFWGFGHTAETDPTNKGWRCKGVRGRTDLWVVGRRGVAGCASIRVWDNGALDVALYPEEDPVTAAKRLASGVNVDARYVQIPGTPGAGLQVIREILEASA